MVVSGVEEFNKIFEKLVIETINIGDDLLLGICNIETDPDLNFREREHKAVHGLLRNMLHDDTIIVDHNEDGKPTIPGYNISITHTRGYAAVILSKVKPVGVDIEYISDRVERITQRFLRPDELSAFESVTSSHGDWSKADVFLRAWCAKEAVYKYYSEDHLAYFDMRCKIGSEDCFEVENMKRSQSVMVKFLSTDDYVLAWVQ